MAYREMEAGSSIQRYRGKQNSTIRFNSATSRATQVTFGWSATLEIAGDHGPPTQ
jgi:hypothetical protein